MPAEFGIEAEFKALVRRRCGGTPPPRACGTCIKLQPTNVSAEEDARTSGQSGELVSGRRRAPHLRLSEDGRSSRAAPRTAARSGVGPLPWLAPLFLRPPPPRPRLDIAPLSGAGWAPHAGPGVADRGTGALVCGVTGLAKLTR